MNWKLIYENKYQPIEDSAWDDESGDFSWLLEDMSEFKARLLRIPQELKMIPSKERIAKAGTFIKRAISDALIHDFDIRVEKGDDCIRVTFSFDGERERCELQELFSMAHRFSFLNNLYDRERSIVLLYYTCDSVYRGKVVCP